MKHEAPQQTPITPQRYPVRALYDAAVRGDIEAVRAFLNTKVDIDAQVDEIYGNPLQVAPVHGHIAVVRFLPEGADVNAQGGQCGNALQAASYWGCEAVVRLLLEKGAEVNAQGGKYGNALQAASLMGYIALVRLLLEKGADVNAHGGPFGNALHVASARGHKAVVRLLREKVGPDVRVRSSCKFCNYFYLWNIKRDERTLQPILPRASIIQGHIFHQVS
jgi:ankyrin repeat protein